MRKNVPRCRDSDPRPSERESLPITTRPGLPPKQMQHLLILFQRPGKYFHKITIMPREDSKYASRGLKVKYKFDNNLLTKE